MKKTHGYIAFSIVTMISAFLLVLLVSRSIFLYRTRLSILMSEEKVRSRNLAEDCLTLIRLQLREDAEYRPVSKVKQLSSSDACTIVSIDEQGSSFVVRTSAHVHHSSTYLETQLQKGTLIILQKTERAHF